VAGSDFLDPFVVGRKTIEDVYEFIDQSDDVTLERLWVIGQPAPDSVIGAARTGVNSVTGIVKGILEIGSPAGFGVKVFPIGIPVIDGYQVDFGTFVAEDSI
jgi:hypothetical protein